MSERAIVTAVAEGAAERICRSTIRALQELTDTLSGEDSELTNLWEEICVQVQDDDEGAWAKMEIPLAKKLVVKGDAAPA